MIIDKGKTLKFMTALCPCQSGIAYAECCAPLHQQRITAANAQQLMRSRYSAYVLKHIDYIVHTTVPSQQVLLDKVALQQWVAETHWVGLTILKHYAAVSKIHSYVEFNAYFMTDAGRQVHHEQSLFVNIAKTWYFVDPTVPLPSAKQPCICSSGKKFKHCCGALLCNI